MSRRSRASRRRPVHDVLRYPLVVPESDVGTLSRIRENAGELGLDYRVALEVGAFEMVRRYVAQGLGIGVVSVLCLTEADRATLHAIKIPADFGTTTYGVLTRRAKRASPFLNRLLASIDPKLAVPMPGVSPPPDRGFGGTASGR